MEQVSGPVIAVGLVLSAVFIPCAFISGIMGQFFRQFALTISVSTVISAFNSLTLSPALTALLLRPRDKHTAPPLPWFAFVITGGWVGWEFLSSLDRGIGSRMNRSTFLRPTPPWIAAGAGRDRRRIWSAWPLNQVLGFVFRTFNRGFRFDHAGLHVDRRQVAATSLIVLVPLRRFAVPDLRRLSSTPKGFIPSQDKGYLVVNLQLPDSASVGRTEQVMQRIEKTARANRRESNIPWAFPDCRFCWAPIRQISGRCTSCSTIFTIALSPGWPPNAIAATLQAKLQDEDRRWRGESIGCAAVGRLGHRRRFQNDDRRSRQLRTSNRCKRWPTTS